MADRGFRAPDDEDMDDEEVDVEVEAAEGDGAAVEVDGAAPEEPLTEYIDVDVEDRPEAGLSGLGTRDAPLSLEDDAPTVRETPRPLARQLQLDPNRFLAMGSLFRGLADQEAPPPGYRPAQAASLAVGAEVARAAAGALAPVVVTGPSPPSPAPPGTWRGCSGRG